MDTDERGCGQTMTDRSGAQTRWFPSGFQDRGKSALSNADSCGDAKRPGGSKIANRKSKISWLDPDWPGSFNKIVEVYLVILMGLMTCEKQEWQGV
jgi:hypothetical protein